MSAHVQRGHTDVRRTPCQGRWLLVGPLSKPLSNPLIFEEGPAPGSPRKTRCSGPAACLTTLPPRCCVMVVKQSSGAVGDQRGDPGAGTGAVQDCGSGGENRTTTTTAKPQADSRGVGLGECAGWRDVIADAIGERFAFWGSATVWLAYASIRDWGGWLAVRRVAQGDRFAIVARRGLGHGANRARGGPRR